MKTMLFALLALFIFLSCDKEDKDPVTEPQIYFSGILLRDANGLPLNSDTTDWKTTVNWSAKESALFTSLIDPPCTVSFHSFLAVYPNPCEGYFAFNVDKEPTTLVQLRLVDQDFTTLISLDSVLQNQIYLNVEPFGIKDTVRLYYKFVEGNCEYRGHGDIVIQ